MSFDFSSLITDRTQADVSRVEQIAAKIKAGTTSASELAEFNSASMKGAYNYTDLNRVTAAIKALKEQMEAYGYSVPGYQHLQIDHGAMNNVLPEGYKQLRHIESTGTQYINTKFSPNGNTRVVMDMEVTQGATSFLFGARDNSSAAVGSNSFSLPQISGNNLRSDYGSSENNIAVSPLQRLRIDKNKNVTTVNDITVSSTLQSFQCSYNMVLLTVNTGGTIHATPTQAKMYLCQIYDNGSLIRDFVPCMNPGGEVGFYDLVDETFYGNAGTGSFIAGDILEPVHEDDIDYDPYLWYESDVPTTEQMTVYLLNISVIRSILAVTLATPKVPADMDGLTYEEANNIEKILEDINFLLNSSAQAWYYSEDVFSGEV